MVFSSAIEAGMRRVFLIFCGSCGNEIISVEVECEEKLF